MRKHIVALLTFGLSFAVCQTEFTISKQNLEAPLEDLPEFPCNYPASGFVEPEAVSEDLVYFAFRYSLDQAVNYTENVTACTSEDLVGAEWELSACIQPLNTSTNIALAYNATIFCTDQAADELDVANLPDELTVANLAVEAILSYNNDANFLLQYPNVTDIWVLGPVEAESESYNEDSLAAYLNATATSKAAIEANIAPIPPLGGEYVAPAPTAAASTNSPSPASPDAASSSLAAYTVQQALSSSPTGSVHPTAVKSGR